jgi:putative endonuclease
MIYTVYVIRSMRADWWYVGMTDNFERRFLQHNKGQNRSTKPYAPFTLVYKEEHPDSDSARKREKYLKGTTGKRWLRKHFK